MRRRRALRLVDTDAAQPTVPRLLPVLVPVVAAGAAASMLAVIAFSASGPSGTTILGLLALLGASTFVEAFPLPLEGVPIGKTSLATVFIVGTAVLYGWAEATLVALFTQLAVELIGRRPRERVAYNAAVYALAGTAAGVSSFVPDGESFVWLCLQVAAGATAFYLVDLTLVAIAVARSSRKAFPALFGESLRATLLPFTILVSLTLMLVVLWHRSPFLSAALVGPLAALALYQRSVFRELEAMQLALTDPLTGLGNHRHFQERLAACITRAEADDGRIALCLLDVDGLKDVNDHFGHPAGDHVLREVAGRLRRGGEAFRIGGDEFALLLPGRDEAEAASLARAVLDRIAKIPDVPGGGVSVSAGIAVHPDAAVTPESLVRVADAALYRAKEAGKNRVRVYQPDAVDLSELHELVEGPDRTARLRAAASLANAVDARDAYTSSHSYMVGELAACIARGMGLDGKYVELARLAGSLHDLGKLAIPEEILRKPGPLNDAERLVLERHPQIGHRMLDSLGVEPVAAWVLHHHERWDGGGYPDHLGADQIPLGSRIIFVADAYDAMTTERVYRSRMSHEHAIAELERCAGTQFDPGVVRAFVECLERDEIAALKASASAVS
jgi:diguanylate cyclase (GGDEF)-like protein